MVWSFVLWNKYESDSGSGRYCNKGNFSTSSKTWVTTFTDVYDEGEEDEGNPNDDAETIDTNEEDENNEGVFTETTCFFENWISHVTEKVHRIWTKSEDKKTLPCELT